MNNLIDILLAEDEEHIAKLIVFKLAKESFSVTVARNGQEAILLLRKKEWKLIILDVMMPIVNGWQVLKELRSIVSLNDIPVLMLSAKGYQNLEVVGDAEMGAQQYLKKPFDPEDLAKVVKRMIRV
ncbi:MAG: response regulator [Bdellovibrio sp.]|nr:response regulator [Bdellovibrio sp.]